MPRIVKILLSILGGAILLFALVLVGILLFVDPNEYKDDITDAVRDATGRELRIDGDLELSVFPWLGLSLGPTQLGNAPGFGDQPMASVEAVDVKVRLLPLFEKKLEMKTVVLRGLQLNLARRADGRSNWDDLAGTPAAEGETGDSPAGDGDRAAPALAALAIGGIEFKDARITWDDRQSGQHIVVDRLQLQTGALSPGEPVDIELSLDVATNEPPLQNHIELATRVDMDAAFERLGLEDLELRVESRGEALPVTPLVLRLGAQVQADLAQRTASIDDLQLDTLGSELRGDVRLDQWRNGDARIRIEVTDPQALAALLPPDLSARLLDRARLTAEAAWNLDRQTATVKPLRIEAAGLRIDSPLEAKQIIDDPQAHGRLTVAEFSPRRLAKDAGIELPETSDPEVLTRAALSLAFEASPTALAVSDLALLADDTRLTGKASLRDFENPAIRYDLAVDGIDVDRYLPPPSGEAPPPAPVPAGAAVEAAGLPLEPLRALDVDGRLTIGELKAANARLADILLVLKAKDGRLRLHPLQANLYDGSYRGDIRLDVRGDTPKIALDETIASVKAGPLLADVLGEAPISGTANLKAKLTTEGSEPKAMTENLAGRVRLSFLDGAVQGINIGYTLRAAQARIKGRPVPPEEPVKTDFAELSATLDIDKGVIDNRDLRASSPLLRIRGEGTVDLPRESLDYRLTTTVVNTATGQAGKDLAQLKGIPVPIRIRGPFSDPKVGLDLKSVLDAKVRQAADRQRKKLKQKADAAIEKQREKAKEKVEEELNKALKGLFGR